MNDAALDAPRWHQRDLSVTLNELSIESLHEFVMYLRQNAITTSLSLIVEQNGGREDELMLNWVPLWSAISHCAALEEVILKKQFWPQILIPNQFLELVAYSSSIKRLELMCTTPNVSSLNSFLTTTKSVTELRLIGLRLEEPLNSTEAASLSASIAHNNSIELLHCDELESCYLAAILHGLGEQNSSIKKLELHETTVHADAFSNFFRRTTSVTSLCLFSLQMERTRSWAQTARDLSASIAQNNSIERLRFECMDSCYEDVVLTGLSLQNSSIKTLELSFIIQSDLFCTFLRTTTSVTNLYLFALEFAGGIDETEIAQNLSTSVAQNKSIEYLHYSFGEVDYGAAILRGLAQHSRIQTIELHSSVTTMEVASALSAVIKSSTAPLECLKFGPMEFREEWFSVVAQGIRQSQSVSQIVLKGTTLDEDQIVLKGATLDEGSTRLLQGLLTTPTNKRYELTLAVNTHFSKSFETFMKEVLQSNTCVLKLKLEWKKEFRSQIAPFSYTFLSALEDESSSVLESLTLPFYLDGDPTVSEAGQQGQTSRTHFQDLILSLPKIKYLRKLQLDMWQGESLGRNGMLLQALKCNSSLWQVTATNPHEPFSDAEQVEIEYFAKRNKQLHAILQAPRDTLKEPLQVWPQVFHDMRGCEMEASLILFVLKAQGESMGPQDETVDPQGNIGQHTRGVEVHSGSGGLHRNNHGSGKRKRPFHI